MDASLKTRIYHCYCATCRALVRLLKEHSAKLVVSPSRPARLWELAAVFAAGAGGIAPSDIVPARRAYTRHLKIRLSGPISNSYQPLHITHAISNSNHHSKAIQRINLGSSPASFINRTY
jgi:hypothetical protein